MVTTSTPAKEKYTSKPAEAYRDELKRKAKEDEIRYGAGQVTPEGIAGVALTENLLSPGGTASNGRASPMSAAGSNSADDGDFFDTWDKPTNIIAPSPRPASAAANAPPFARVGFGASPAVTPNGSRSASPAVSNLNPSSSASVVPTPSASAMTSPTSATTSAPAPQPSRAISSSSIRTTSSAVGAGATSGRTAGSAMKLGGGKSKLGGVKKGAQAINFEEAERKAKEEEERIKRLGYDREQEEKQAAAARASAAAAGNTANSSRTGTPSGRGGEMIGHKSNAVSDVDRMGMGFGRLGFGQTSGLSGEDAAKAAQAAKRAAQRAASGYVEPEESTVAREKFGTQKGISSDQFFGRNNYDPTAKAEAQARLAQFSGATAISSNAYFGRPEEEEGQYGNGRGNDEGLLGVESLSDLERTAKDAARRLMQQAGIEGEYTCSYQYWKCLLTYSAILRHVGRPKRPSTRGYERE